MVLAQVVFVVQHENIHGVSRVNSKTRYTIVSWWDIESYDVNEEEELIWNQL